MCILSCPVVSDSLQPHGLWPARLLCLWNFPGKPPLFSSELKLHESPSCGEIESGVGEVLGVGTWGLPVILGRPAFSSIEGPLVLSYPISPPCCLWAWAPTPCILLSARLFDSGSGSALVGWCPTWCCPMSTAAPARSGPRLSPAPSAPGPGAGVERAAARLHPGGPGSLQAVGLQLQTPKHILWEVSLACGWGIPLFW